MSTSDARPDDPAHEHVPLRVLVVDDEQDTRAVLEEMLLEHHATCVSTDGLRQARAELARHPENHFDVVLLDVLMTDGSGWELLRELRNAGDLTPVIFVTSISEVGPRTQGLAMGADDFVVKPFTAEELVARIDAVVRRHRAMPALVHGDLRLSLADRTLQRAGQAIDLTPTEFEVMRVLMEARGRPVSRAQLLHKVWGIEHEPGTTVVEVLVGRLRRKVDRHGPVLLRTVPGQGYCLSDGQRQGTESP